MTGGDVARGIEALARKYAMIAELRRARARGEPVPDKRVFRALAQEFPGVLNELDNLPLDEIDRRVAALARARDGGAEERWIRWMHGYHALMRAALYVKIRVARGAELSDAEATSLAARASAHARSEVDADFVRAVKDPPEGRLTRVVFARLSTAFGTAPEEIREALFPRRPRGP